MTISLRYAKPEVQRNERLLFLNVSGGGAMLRAGRKRVRFPIEFISIYLILPTALGHLATVRNRKKIFCRV
jgi:hypothetical protein